MKQIGIGILVGILSVIGTNLWAHEEQGQTGEQTLTGEVVDIVCYLSHGKEGLGKAHADCAKKCIKSGLPVALKVGDQLYLASLADHTTANTKLADFAGQSVKVHGTIRERDGQHLIEISQVEKAQ